MVSKPPTPIPLGRATVIATTVYATGVVIVPLIGTFVKLSHTADAAIMRLAPVLAVTSVVSYAMSLWIEYILLHAMEKQGTASGTGVLVIMMSAFGLSISLYGLILSLLGVARWPLFFYVLCFIHGVHLLARAQSFPRPAGS